MEEKELKKVFELLRKEKVREAQELFQLIEPSETADYWLAKGKLEQKFQNWGNALNAYSKVLEINPENFEAKNQLHVIQNILNFWNPEMFNP